MSRLEVELYPPSARCTRPLGVSPRHREQSQRVRDAIPVTICQIRSILQHCTFEHPPNLGGHLWFDRTADEEGVRCEVLFCETLTDATEGGPRRLPVLVPPAGRSLPCS